MSLPERRQREFAARRFDVISGRLPPRLGFDDRAQRSSSSRVDVV